MALGATRWQVLRKVVLPGARTGIVGAVTVSGLPQREDHNLVVEALCLLTGRDYRSLQLPPA